MAMAMDLQARLGDVRARLENVRPGILPNLAEKFRGGQGLAGGNVVQRAQAILEGRPIIGQAMRGTLITGGKPNPASATLALRAGGFRPVEGPSQAVETIRGYRIAR